MNILITGCAGFFGHNLAIYLLKNYPAFKITGVDNLLTGKKELVTESAKKEAFTTYPKLSSDAYLFFPGDNPEMLRLAMAASASTGK
jgi:nucleoside-diphosphate-sugar epimerase